MADARWPYSYEPGRTRFYESFIAACTCLCPGGIATYAVGGGLLRYVVGTLTVLVSAWAVVRSFRVGLWANADRVLVRNFWITREFVWGEVKDVFLALLTMGITPVPAWLFRLQSGRVVRVRATPQRGDRREVEWEALRRLAPTEVVFNAPDRW
jgi:hypothetical protein